MDQNVQEYPPFFIIGVGRSGTTLLRLMLHHHPRIAIPYETEFIARYHRELGKYGDLCAKENRIRLIHDILEEPDVRRWDHEFDPATLYDAVETPDLRGILSAIYGDYARKRGKVRWGDKSRYLDELPEVNAVFPDAQYIHIMRDGRDVAQSVLKMSWGPRDIMQAANWWKEHVWLARRMGGMLGPKRYLEVRFEDLVRNPQHELTRITAFLGEAFSPAMLEYHRNSASLIPKERSGQHYNVNQAPNTARIFAWKKSMKAVDIAIFDRYAGRILEECGYERPGTAVHPLRTALGLGTIVSKRLGRNIQRALKEKLDA